MVRPGPRQDGVAISDPQEQRFEDRDASGHGFIYTVGHSNHTTEKFLDLLKTHGIEVLVEVRSHPYSRYAPHFNAREIKAALADAGIRYLFLGRELGGRPEGEEFYDADGRVDYRRVSQSPLFEEGIYRLERGLRKYRIALLCSEEDPVGCHRRLLVGRVLAGRDVEVLHIRRDGNVQAEEDLTAGQPALFGEEDKWKSILPVSPKSRHPSSSAS